MIRFDSMPPEVMQAMCTPMHLIIPPAPAAHTGALYLGSFTAALDEPLLDQHRIAALMQVLDAPWVPNAGAAARPIDCYRLDILDSSTADIRPHLEQAVRWIDDRLRRGMNVLVHCQQVCSSARLRCRGGALTEPCRA